VNAACAAFSVGIVSSGAAVPATNADAPAPRWAGGPRPAAERLAFAPVHPVGAVHRRSPSRLPLRRLSAQQHQRLVGSITGSALSSAAHTRLCPGPLRRPGHGPAQPGRVLTREPLPGRAPGSAMTCPAVAALLRGLFVGHPAAAESPRGGRRPVPSLQVRRLRPPSLSTRRSRRLGRVRAAGDEAVAVPGVRPPAAKITFTGRDRTAPVSEDGHLQARRSPCGCGPELGTGGALGAGGFSSGPQPWHRLRGDESRW